jgi:hypothetical protein
MKTKFILKAKNLNKKWLQAIKFLYGKEKIVITIDTEDAEDWDLAFDDDEDWWEDDDTDFEDAEGEEEDEEEEKEEEKPEVVEAPKEETPKKTGRGRKKATDETPF